MVSCKISLLPQTCYSLCITASCGEHSSMNIQFFSPEKSQAIRTQTAFHVFNLIVSIETVTNCGKEAGTRTECFCQHWVNSVLSLRQPKGYSENQSWCRVQVSCPIYFAWKLFLPHCSMFSWHIRDVSSTRPQVKTRPHLSSNSLQSQGHTTSQIRSNPIYERSSSSCKT